MTDRYGERADTPETEPAPTITSKARTASWVVATGQQSRQAEGPEPFERNNAPSPTVDTGVNRWKVKERQPAPTGEPTHYDQRQTGAKPPPVDEPAPSMLAKGLAKGVPVWTNERPATTVAADPRVGEPGHRDREGGERQFQKNAVRVTLEQAAILQGFPSGYPWQGSRTACFTQVGNAVPPPLARAVIAALIGRADEQSEAA